MPRATRTLSGASLKKYFRDLFATEPELTPKGADRLKARCCAEISQLRVRAPVPSRLARQALTPAQPVIEDIEAASSPSVATVQPSEETGANAAELAEPEQSRIEPALEPPFDPYAFSLVALLKRSGRDALRSRLDEIGSPQNLQKLAEAQHIALPPGVDAPADLREAIVSGTEQRLADRRAAAS